MGHAMLLSAGDRLGPYEILAPLGSGGMGEVYKARDSRLGREVAIKLLRGGALAGPDRTARFMQEARAASALNHPNIITIYDVGLEAGSDFLVMEYVKGRSLDQLIPRHGLPVREALRIAVQIADALSRAHAAGIIHRDLKPANVMVTGEGQVKVLDFGLAKLTGPIEPSELDPTLTERPHTEDGTILGTLSYMSPEQTEGKKLDPRSDIFSFGAVLYEMLTGRRAFEGGSKASTMAAILREDPKPAREVAAGVPLELERIVSRALRKDPARRFQHMDDVKVELEELKEESDSGKLAPAATQAPAKSSRGMLAIGAAAIAVAAVTAVLFLRGRTVQEPRAGALAPVRLTSDAGLTRQPAIWASGNLIAYASDRAGNNLDIWVQQLQSGETRRLTTHTSDNHEPDFSPDGSRIVFRSERDGGGIYQISTLGGAEKRIADGGHNPKYSPDGAWIAYWIGDATFRRMAFGRIMVVPAGGGEPRELTTSRRAGIEPVWAPDSKHVLFLGGERGSAVDAFVVPLQGGDPIATGMFKILEDHKLSTPEVGAWSGDRVIVSAQSGDSRNLWRLTLDPRTFHVTGSPEQLTSGVGSESHPAVAAGRLIFASLQENSDIWYLPLNADEAKVTGEPHRLTTALTQEMNCAVTGDGSRVVYGSRRGEGADFVLHDVATGHTSIIASGSVPRPAPRISADGSKVSYYTSEGDKFRSFVIPAAGGVPQSVCDDCQARSWAWDGRRLVISKFPRGGTGLLDVTTRQFQIIGRTANAPRTSWDDRWLAFYGATEPGRTKLFIVPIHDGGETPRSEWIEATDGSAFDVVPEFSPNGKLLYFQSQRDGSRCLWALRLDPATKRPAGAPFPVYHFHSARQSPMNVPSGTAGNAVAKDKVVYTSVERTGNIWMVKLD